MGQRLHAQLEAGRAVLARAAAGVAALDGAVQALRAQAARPSRILTLTPASSAKP